MRERELKRLHQAHHRRRLQSLPMRERELKRVPHIITTSRAMSLPMRERELKQLGELGKLLTQSRSPCGSVN